MNKSFTFPALLAGLALALNLAATAFGAEIISVEPVGEDAVAAPEPLGPQQLEDLVGPVALYPDDLLAIVLPAATYPLDIVKAARFLEAHELDSAAQPDDAWDESVIALLNYPEVVKMLDNDLDWTWALGEAVLFQEDDLIAAVERFRDRAYEAGNLRSDEHQVVEIDNGSVSIAPVRKEVIYVPYYEPRQVIVYQRVPVYHYYPRAYPVYYYPYPADHYFSSGFFWGVSTAFHISFHSRHLRLHHYSYASHPYYGHHYYPAHYRHHRFHRSAPSYRNAYRANYRSGHSVTVSRSYGGDQWRGSYRTGVRPREYNDHNYPRRHVVPKQQSNASQHSTTRASTRHATAPAAYAANRSAAPARRQYGNTLTSSQATHDRRDSARDASSSRSNTSRTTTTRTSTAQRNSDTREQAHRQTQQRDGQRAELSREQTRRQTLQRTAQRSDASRDLSRQQSQQRATQYSGASREQRSRQAPPQSAAPAETRSRSNARTQTSQRDAEPRKSSENKRSTTKKRSEKRNDSKDSRRSR